MKLAHYTSGKFMLYFVRINFFINNWGFIVAYIVLVKKLYLIYILIYLLFSKIKQWLMHLKCFFQIQFLIFLEILMENFGLQ